MNTNGEIFSEIQKQMILLAWATPVLSPLKGSFRYDDQQMTIDEGERGSINSWQMIVIE